MENRRVAERSDRRAHRRGGRRQDDIKKPWYVRRRLWLAVATLAYVGWRRVRRLARIDDRPQSGMAA